MKLTFTKKPINDKNIWWITSSLANLFDGLVGILTLGYFHSNLSNITVFWHLEKQGKLGVKDLIES